MVTRGLFVLALVCLTPLLIVYTRRSVSAGLSIRFSLVVALYWGGGAVADASRLWISANHTPSATLTTLQVAGLLLGMAGYVLLLRLLHPNWREIALDSWLVSAGLVGTCYAVTLLATPLADDGQAVADALTLAGTLWGLHLFAYLNAGLRATATAARALFIAHGALRALGWLLFAIDSGLLGRVGTVLDTVAVVLLAGSYFAYAARVVLQLRWDGKAPTDFRDRNRLPHLPYLAFAIASAVTLACFGLDRRTLHPAVLLLAGLCASVIVGRQILTLNRYSHLAFHDSLTQLANRARLLHTLEDRLVSARTREDPAPDEVTAVLFVDLDRFKQVNDTNGHAVGDEVLRQVARRLTVVARTLAETDSSSQADLGRLGGDEFLLITSGRPLTELAQLAGEIRDSLSRPFEVGELTFQLGASVGIATALASEPVNAEELVRRADLAMYSAKRDHHGWALYDPGLSRRAVALAAGDVEVARALRDRRLLVHLQPMVEPGSRRVQMVEALLRWQDDTGAVREPTPLLDFARRSGQMEDLSYWVIESATAMLAGERTRLSVNVPPSVLCAPRFNDTLAELLARTGLPPGQLELEITEDQLVDLTPQAAQRMNQLRDNGIRIVIDDFGTGFSSLGYLLELPLDGLKIDRRFTHALPESEVARSVVRSVVAVAADVGLTVVAEGVETEAQHECVLQLGVELGQGFFYAAPGPAELVLARPHSIELSPRTVHLPEHSLSRRASAASRRPGSAHSDGDHSI